MKTKEEILNTFVGSEGAWWAYKEGIQTGYNEAFNSLRNQAAIAAMQGIISNNRYNVSTDMVAKMAVKYADALIKELNLDKN